jgi:hypothetical protein
MLAAACCARSRLGRRLRHARVGRGGAAEGDDVITPASPKRKRSSPERQTARSRIVQSGSRGGVLRDARIRARLFRKGPRVCQRGRSRWVSCSEGRGGLGGGETDRPDRAFPGPLQAPAVAIWWLWNFGRLWVAVINRHSARAADLPRRWKRSMRRLNFVCPNTGSIIAWRLR